MSRWRHALRQHLGGSILRKRTNAVLLSTRRAQATNSWRVEVRTEHTVLMLARLDPIPVRCLLRAIAADRHAAPPSGMAPRVVRELQRAGRAFAGLHVGKVLRTDEPSQRLSDGK